MVHGEGISIFPNAVNVQGYAHNGTGTVVVVYNDATYVLVSTDYGRTWSKIAHNLPGANVGVVWLSGRFILASAATTTTSSDSVKCSYSTTGATFTAGGTVVLDGVAYTGNTSIATDGTRAIICIGSSSGATKVVSTTDGVTLTSRTVPSAPYGTDPKILYNASAGANGWLICASGGVTTAARSTVADGSAWEVVTLPANFANTSGAASGLGLFVIGTLTNFYTSTNGATGSWSNIGNPQIPSTANTSGTAGIAGKLSINFDGTRFVLGTGLSLSGSGGSQFMYTTDFRQFTTRQIIPQSISNQTNLYLTALPAGNAMMFLPASPSSGSSTSYIWSANWLTSSEYVGSSVQFSMPALTSIGAQRIVFGYVRVD
ncbi:hypothetical protein [Undibacterium sp. CY21W]|uniref:hypothetical protein n=1 Tax=Undibacterium sp. CY21W TaxID=2762293 RepID=UPI00164CA95E|nr:hypothetical protein [Undibacterium sp. CY21W]MBC3927769.1 hypothetical protein [Undibacterium sp. CY21W]